MHVAIHLCDSSVLLSAIKLFNQSILIFQTALHRLDLLIKFKTICLNPMTNSVDILIQLKKKIILNGQSVKLHFSIAILISDHQLFFSKLKK